MEYCLGDPDGSATLWSADPTTDLDGDGALEAFAIDLDGDGLTDDVLADLDGDGLADHGVLDLDGDGVPEAYVTDDGTGTWAVSADRAAAVRWFGLDGGRASGRRGAGRSRRRRPGGERLVDTDGDGLADRAFGAGAAWVDTDGDGRWDVHLVDADGDGRADSADQL